MLISTHGIVFHTTRYADSGAVVKIYTEKFGLQSFLVKGLYSRKSKLKAALFSHLSILDLRTQSRLVQLSGNRAATAQRAGDFPAFIPFAVYAAAYPFPGV
jgi:recombinational DNA repair protein (RecF pathway)